ncbi:hypothetical protein [Micromonospora sp. NBC_00421]|uniref:hypothetical protein n=1 Tax=Micromonospora sp. NBC_00421 TaxID=2975976 RepID=UPI002E2366F0
MTDIRAIETSYAGCLFRSRTEARWAVFFDNIGLAWQHESQGFEVGKPAKRYLPDFYLPKLGLHVEVKPAMADVADPDGVLLWENFAGMVATKWDHDKTAMFCGPPPNPAQVDRKGPPRAGTWYEEGIVILGDWHYAWCVCPAGEHFDIQFEARGGRILCGCPRITDDRYFTGNHPRILAAYRAARSARFEHGEHGQQRAA